MVYGLTACCQNPGGSSSGPAAGVAAGYAPVSIGSETNGSLVLPANRAALYTLKPTIGAVSTTGIIPICRFCDTAGPMTKNVRDLANIMDIIVDRTSAAVPDGGYISAVTGAWKGLRVGTVDPEVWKFSDEARKPSGDAEEQMVGTDDYYSLT